MANPRVAVLAQGVEYPTTTPYTVVPAGQVVITVHHATSRNIRLDGRDLRLTGRDPGVLALDLTRSTGFHHLRVDGLDHWFGTQDAKLGLDGLEAMLQELRTFGTAWSGQLLFSNGEGLRDPHVTYAWLDTRADEALTAVEQIVRAPRLHTESRRRLQRHGGAGMILVGPTIRLLRSRPKEYLSENTAGPLQIGPLRYEPLRVVARTRRSTLDSLSNRRAIQVAQWIVRLCNEVLMEDVDKSSQAALRLWRQRASSLTATPLGQALANSQPIPLLRQPEEVTDPRYQRSYEIYADIAGSFGWSASVPLKPRLSYVQQSDSIYQAYVATRVARHLDLKPRQAVLTPSLAFRGEDYDLYYDVHPPRDVLRSWRADTDMPDASRPDLLLVERSTGRVAVVDAKYRILANQATEDSRKEVSAYLSLYGLHKATIAFPGDGEQVREVAGHGMALVETAISPAISDIDPAVRAILDTLEHAPY